MHTHENISEYKKHNTFHFTSKCCRRKFSLACYEQLKVSKRYERIDTKQ
jgi:hypothetical protein